MKRFLHILFLLIISIQTTFGQGGETNHWFFGRYGAVNFVNKVPNVLSTSQLSTLEGSASISDPNGNLLFYTDGIRVWNRNHVIMENGSDLYGDPSSTSSAIIVPKPNSCDTFYIFTVDMQGGDALFAGGDADGKSRGMRYSMVDMTANGGLGRVVNSQKI